jgi:hypothetical protein
MRYCSRRCGFLGRSAVPAEGPPWTVDENGCWNWDLTLSPTGYGRISNGVLAHRWLYERMVGPLSPFLELDHLCRNHACVNPEHLEEVPRLENVRRGDVPKLTEEDKLLILGSDLPSRALAREFGVGKTTILRVRRGV